ncbi:hypothetical protein AB9E35_33520, partial [Rhizobium leguminosarum]
WTAKITADRMQFDGKDLRGISGRQRRRIFGKDMAMIFQEPMSSLNPCFTVGFQLGETLRFHMGLNRKHGNGFTRAGFADNRQDLALVAGKR